MTTDESCLHASLATLLEETTTQRPAQVLGRVLRTDAYSQGDGLVWGDVLPGLLGDIRAVGVAVDHQPLDGDFDVLRDRLADGLWIMAVLDTYELEHYWIDRGRTHAPHAVLLRQPSQASDVVLLRDVMEITQGEFATRVEDLKPAAITPDLGLAVIRMGVSGSIPGGGTQHTHSELTPVAVVDALRRWAFEMDGQSITRSEKEGAHTTAEEATRMLRGLWNFLHACRWHGMYLRESGQASEDIERAGQNLLIVRGLLMRRSAATGELARRYTTEIERRLGIVRDAFETAGDLSGRV